MPSYTRCEITVTGPEVDVKRFKDVEVLPFLDGYGITILDDTPAKLVYQWLYPWMPVPREQFHLKLYPAIDIKVAATCDIDCGQDEIMKYAHFPPSDETKCGVQL